MFAIITSRVSRSEPTQLEAAIREGALLDAVSKDMLAQVHERFDTARDAEGQPWTPLQPSTVKKKGSSIILRRTGALRSSFASSKSVAANRATVKSPSRIAQIHQSGVVASAGSGGLVWRLIPRRIYPEKTIGGKLPPSVEARIKAVLRASVNEYRSRGQRGAMSR